jgi:Kef-type K+ transport system membrane component KefB|nr:MAG TPA: hypothetical protein [Caudoviricetes sp.]
MKRFVKWFLFLCALLVIIFTVGIVLMFVSERIVGTMDSPLFAIVFVLLVVLVSAAVAAIAGEDL